MSNRNQPCPCASGKKFKKCCGSEAALNEQRHEAKAKQMEALRARAAEREREMRGSETLAILALFASTMSSAPISRREIP